MWSTVSVSLEQWTGTVQWIVCRHVNTDRKSTVFRCVSIKQFYLVQIKLVGPTVNSKGNPVSSGKRIRYDVA